MLEFKRCKDQVSCFVTANAVYPLCVLTKILGEFVLSELPQGRFIRKELLLEIADKLDELNK